jgi:glycosyltransferase involved in cell wall biosynthesis
VWCVPAPSWRDWWHRNPERHKRFNYGSAPQSGFYIYRPEKYLPRVGRPRFLARWTEQERLQHALRVLRTTNCLKTILYFWRPCFEPAFDLLRHDLSCYHIDDEYTFSENEQPISEQEARLAGRVDQVFIHSPGLLEKKGMLNPSTAFVPNGVDYQAYVTPRSEPEDLMPIPHPRIGYVGRIKRQLDLDLLVNLAERHKDWSWVFVGPCQAQSLDGKAALIKKLFGMPNVFALGAKPVSDLPAYTQHLDVCILCYELNDYTKFIYPLKLHEYFATGRPAVGTPIRSLEKFAHVMKLARTPDEWSKALQDSLSPSDPYARHVKERQCIARQHDWDKIATFIAHTLCKRLGRDYLERFKKISPHPNRITF